VLDRGLYAGRGSGAGVRRLPAHEGAGRRRLGEGPARSRPAPCGHRGRSVEIAGHDRDMERKRVNASTIRSVGYDPAAQLLEIEFTSGTIMQYTASRAKCTGSS